MVPNADTTVTIEAASDPVVNSQEYRENAYTRFVGKIQNAVYRFFSDSADLLWKIFYLVLLLLYVVYFLGAMIYKFGDEGSVRLLVVTLVVAVYFLHRLVSRRVTRRKAKTRFLGSCWARAGRLRDSVPGLGNFMLEVPRVQWRPVILGVLLQFILGVVILRTQWGYASFQYLGERVTHFLSYTDAGSRFLFGDEYKVHFMAFRVLPTVVFFSAFVSMMYYLGFMQFLIRNVGRFLAFCLGTSPAESVVAAANIFIGMITAHHLLSASVMSAPAALAVAKLFYPETETIKIEAKDVMKSEKRSERNIIEAASNGASQSIALVANIAVNLIAFVALLDGINATLIWFGERVGMHDPKLTFQLLCSYLFYPLSVLMGVDAKDRLVLGELIGTKTFLNEFVAYLDLSVYIKNKEKLAEYVQYRTW
nr:hypothetical protein BaRGS_034203 [Batillaria attramentaria]